MTVAWSLSIGTAAALGTGCQRPLPEKHRVPSGQSYRVQTAHSSERRILVVHSYYPDFPWTRDVHAGILETLREKDVAVDVFYMNTKNRPDRERLERISRQVLEKIHRTAPDLVITCDDNAQKYVTSALIGSSTPVVFCGVNADPTKYGAPAANVTGVIERPHFRESLRALRRITPVQRLAVLSSMDVSSRETMSLLQEQFQTTDVEIVEVRLVRTFREWREAVLDAHGRADALAVYLYHSLESDTPGQMVDPSAVMDWTRRNCILPTLGFSEFGVRDGLLVSVAVSGQAQGRLAATYALQVLDGRPMGQLPIVPVHAGKLMVNMQTAELLGLSVPPDLLSHAEQIGVP